MKPKATMQPTKKKVAVIGGGVSGLVATKTFLERGHDVTSFERSHDIGGVWEPSRSYPDVQTQSPKDLYCYTDHPMPDDYPEWPKGFQVHDYLHDYAKKHDLMKHYLLNSNILKMTKATFGKRGWVLRIERDGRAYTEFFEFVVVCTGQFSDKKMVTFPGEKEFKDKGGIIIHTSEYKNPNIIEGKKVVILGGSKSATDVAVNVLHNNALSTTVVYRRNVWRAPYKIGGINFKHLLYMRMQENQFNDWNRSPMDKFISSITYPFVWANFRALETLLKVQLKLGKFGMVPDTQIEDDANCSLPIATPGFFEALENGSLKAIKSTFSHYTDHSKVVLDNGNEIDADVVILATGWHLGVPFLQKEYKDKLIDAKDGLYKLYRLSVNPSLPDMGFVGFNSSFCTVLSAEMIANWLVRYADNQLAYMPTEEEMNDAIDELMDWKRNERPAADVYGGLCSAPFHFKHFDELLSDMGAKKTKRENVIAENFSYPCAKSYGEFLASCPDYKVVEMSSSSEV